MLVDSVTITFRGGHGGKGAVAFNKTRLNLGPTGADGGLGGSVYLEGTSDLSALQYFANRKEVAAQNGENGKGQFNDGKRGEDVVVKVPIGTVVTNIQTQTAREITHVGERLMVAGGGKGGRGNFKFRGPSNTSPTEFEEGTPGDELQYRLDLKMIADVGLVGLPNAGKSSLLNELTNAKSKVGNYQFTTLEAHLGDFYGVIVADIPGLIEGASEGKGLGDKFLRHVERTRVLFHLVSAESEQVTEDYRTIRNELAAYNPTLLEKKEYVFLTKSDMVDAARLKTQLVALKNIGVEATAITVLDSASVEPVRALLRLVQKEKNAPLPEEV